MCISFLPKFISFPNQHHFPQKPSVMPPYIFLTNYRLRRHDMDQDPKEQFHNLLWHVWRKFPRLRECKRQHFFVGKLLWRLGHLCTYENKTFRKKFTLVPLLRLCALFWNKLITLDRPSLPTQPHFWSGCFHLKSVKKRKNRKSRLLTQTKTRLTIRILFKEALSRLSSSFV